MSSKRTYISNEEIAKLSGEEKEHFLNPNARRVQKSLGDLTGITGFGFNIVDVQLGFETTELHVHHYEDECIFVLSGTATARVGEKEFQISQGDFLGYRKLGAPHSVKNTSNEVFRFIVVGERKENDVVDYPRLNKRLIRNSGAKLELADIEE